MPDTLHTSVPQECKPILIVLAGRTYPEISATQGDYENWIAAGLGDILPHQVLDARHASSYPARQELAGVVISGSHAMVTDREPWSEHLATWLRTCVDADLPVLGICYGHQLLAHAMGGKVEDRTNGPETGTRQIILTPHARQDLLFSRLPETFPAQLVHYQSVLALPKGAQLLASSALEPHQAFRAGRYAWGLQFHPEFSARAMRGYLQYMEHQQGSPQDAQVTDTPESAGLLRRFAALSRSLMQAIPAPVPLGRSMPC